MNIFIVTAFYTHNDSVNSLLMLINVYINFVHCPFLITNLIFLSRFSLIGLSGNAFVRSVTCECNSMPAVGVAFFLWGLANNIRGESILRFGK